MQLCVTNSIHLKACHLFIEKWRHLKHSVGFTVAVRAQPWQQGASQLHTLLLKTHCSSNGLRQQGVCNWVSQRTKESSYQNLQTHTPKWLTPLVCCSCTATLCSEHHMTDVKQNNLCHDGSVSYGNEYNDCTHRPQLQHYPLCHDGSVSYGNEYNDCAHRPQLQH